MRKPVNAQRMAEGAIALFASSALLGAAAGWALVYAVRAAARGLWKRAMRRLYPHVQRQRAADLHQKAKDAGLTPALASRTEPWEPAPKPDTPPPWWTDTDTMSPAELTLFDDGVPLRRPR